MQGRPAVWKPKEKLPLVQCKSEDCCRAPNLGGSQSSVPFRPSPDSMRSTHIRESNLLYSKSTDANVNLIQKHPCRLITIIHIIVISLRVNLTLLSHSVHLIACKNLQILLPNTSPICHLTSIPATTALFKALSLVAWIIAITY